jgi:hypothetical protein
MNKCLNRICLIAACIGMGTAQSARAADITSDFIFRHNTTGSDAVWVMSGVSYSASALLSPDPVSDLNWKIVATGDFNRDGHSDLVWWHSTDGQIKVWYMNGASRTSEVFFGSSPVSDTNWRIVGVADFNKDGNLDLVWQHATTYQIAIWYMNGLNLLSSTITSPSTASGWWIVGIGDFNWDGHPDFLFQNQTLGDLAIWYMNDYSLISSTLTTPSNPGTGWQAIDAANMNGDSSPDILFQHTDSSIAVWYMNGASMTLPTATDPASPGDVNWRIAATGEVILSSTDSDGDGLPDSWENFYFGNLSQTANGDYDGDGWTNLQEFRNQTNPTRADLKITIGKPRSQSRIP